MTSTCTSIIAFAGSAAAALALTPLARVLAHSGGFIDQPHARKIHVTPIARLGGVAIAAAVLLVATPLLAWWFHHQPIGREMATIITILLAAAGLLLIGALDDLVAVRSTYKLLALLIAAFAVVRAGGTLDTITVRGHDLIRFGWLAGPITMLWIVGVSVSINFIDGLDGLAAGIVATAAAVIAIGALVTGQMSIAIIALCLTGSLSGFLFYNRHPASIFMGDSGSMFIGFLLAAIGVPFAQTTGASPGILLPAIVLVVPLLDTVFTFLRRGVLQRRSIFSPERGHIHHRLLDAGLCHQHAVILLQAITICAAVTALLLRFADAISAVSAVVILIALVGILFKASGSSRGRELVAALRRNRAIGREKRQYRGAFEEAQLRFRNARTFAEWWQNVCEAAEALDVISLRLPLTTRDGNLKIQTWHAANGHPHPAVNGSYHPAPARASLPIQDRRSGPALVADVELATNSTLESAGQRIALFARLMEEQSLASLPDESLAADRQSPDPEPDAPFALADTDSPTARLKVAVVHDFLYTYAGAERVLEQILAIYPQADVFSLFDFLPAGQRGFIQNKAVTASFLQRLPLARNHHRAFLPLMPMAIEQFDLSGYDLIISSSYCVAKGVITSPRQLHVCYCHTPVRYAWDLQPQYTNQKGLRNLLRSFVARAVFHYIRTWDVRSANGVDVFIANSQFVGQRIEKTYRRRSTILHPPVNTDFFTPPTSDHRPAATEPGFYLTASRLVPYKRIDLIVEAFKHLPDKKLIVIGDGPEMTKLRALAGPNVRLLGHQSCERLRHYMQLAKGFIFAAEEDFGIVPVEAQACGTPVLAFAQGGALETIRPGETGLFFQHQTVESLLTALAEFDQMEWNTQTIRYHAERFSQPRFRQELRRKLDEEWHHYRHHHQLRQSAEHLAETLLPSISGIGPSDTAHAGNGNGHRDRGKLPLKVDQ